MGRRQRRFVFRVAGTEHPVTLRYGRGPHELSVAGKAFAFTFRDDDGEQLAIELGGVTSRVVGLVAHHEIYVRTRNGRFDFHLVDPFGVDDEDHAGEDRIVAPLPGTVVAVHAKEGETLAKGAAILTLEVMKMEQTLRAPFDGKVKALRCKIGDIVAEGAELAEMEEHAGAGAS